MLRFLLPLLTLALFIPAPALAGPFQVAGVMTGMSPEKAQAILTQRRYALRLTTYEPAPGATPVVSAILAVKPAEATGFLSAQDAIEVRFNAVPGDDSQTMRAWRIRRHQDVSQVSPAYPPQRIKTHFGNAFGAPHYVDGPELQWARSRDDAAVLPTLGKAAFDVCRLAGIDGLRHDTTFATSDQGACGVSFTARLETDPASGNTIHTIYQELVDHRLATRPSPAVPEPAPPAQ